jgi:glutaminyl-tRNA synthetase
MGVFKPLRVVIDNYPEGQVEEMAAINNPDDPAAGTRPVPFSKVLYIEQTTSVKSHRQSITVFHRAQVRLRYAYFIKCTGVVR